VEREQTDAAGGKAAARTHDPDADVSASGSEEEKAAH